jgi:hypothetical protein
MLMMRTGGAGAADWGFEVGTEGVREMTVPPGRVMAAEPGRIVKGSPPIDAVKTMDEALGSRAMGELPMVAMTGASLGAGADSMFVMEDELESWFGES